MSGQPKRIVVILSTGKQGSGVVKALAQLNREAGEATPAYEILAVTRSAQGARAKEFVALPGVTILEADSTQPAAVIEKAKAGGPIYGVFSVQQSFDNPAGGIKGEVRQANELADAAAEAGVQHFVYTSVDFGTDDASPQETNIPHFESKRTIEEYIKSKHANSFKLTILRPVAFMDNIANVNTFQGKLFATVFATQVKKPLQLIACSDIGFFAAYAFSHPDEYAGKELSLAGDTLTGAQIKTVFEETKRRPLPQTFGFLASAVTTFVGEMRTMFNFFNGLDGGYRADIPALRKIHPGLKTFKDYLQEDFTN